jgi:hypothetical protein
MTTDSLRDSSRLEGALATALSYARRCWLVLPLHTCAGSECSCCRPDCGSPGKHPLTKNGLKDASADDAVVRGWWTRWPSANVGIATGSRSGFVVLDVDPRNGGNESLAELESAHGKLPETYEALTGGGGRHIYFSAPGTGISKRSGFLPGLDFQADGAYVVAPPSLHMSGGFYLWKPGRAPGDCDLSPIPDWLIARLQPKREPAARSGEGRIQGAASTEYALAALREEVDRVQTATEGVRNDTLNRAAFSLAQLCAGGQLDEHLARAGLMDAALAAGLPDHESRATLESAFRAGRAEPRHPDLRTTRARGSARHSRSAPTPAVTPDGRESITASASYVLIPGQHIMPRGELIEVGSDDFANEVLTKLPEGILYRLDEIVGEIAGSAGARKFVEISSERARLLVDEHVKLARWKTTAKKKPSRVFLASTNDEAKLVLAAAPHFPRVRPLQLLTRHPVFAGAEWSLVHPGWNESTGILYDEPEALVGIEPARRTPHECAEFFDDLLIDFPFKDAASLQNFLGLLLTPLVAPAVGGCLPMHLVMSSLERVGKGLLITSILGHGVCGGPIAPFQLGTAEDEREKRITSLILGGATAIHLDNLPTKTVLDSAALSSLLTSRVWRGRPLGHSRVPELPNNLILVGSGNNIRATGEVAKRCVPIWLDPQDDRPEERASFGHPDIVRYARETRPRILATLTGMVETWKSAGCPEGLSRLGGFEEWARSIGGIMRVAGFDSWLANYREWTSTADDWSADAHAFAELWWSRYHGERVKATDALGLLSSTQLFPSVTDRPERGRLMAFAKSVLLPMLSRPLGPYRLLKENAGNNSAYWLSFDPRGSALREVATREAPGGPGRSRTDLPARKQSHGM